LINDFLSRYSAVEFGRGPKHLGLEGLHIKNAIPHLIAQLEKQRAAGFGSPAFQCGLTDLPAFGKFSLGHASSFHSLHPSAGVVRTAMKALFVVQVKQHDTQKEFDLLDPAANSLKMDF
jgi:hypothetical protein